MAGHLFVMQGDLTKLACDAWLLPTDQNFHIERHWLLGAPTGIAQRITPEGCLRTPKPQGWSNNGVRVVRCDDWTTTGAGPQPWLANVGLTAGTSIEWYLHAVRQFLKEAAVDAASRGVAFGRSRPLLALPVVGTGEGGAHAVKGGVSDQLVAELLRSAQGGPADIVLVTHTGAALSAAQTARRQHAGAWSEVDPDLREKAKSLAAIARRERLVLFIGAGASRGAGLPGWRELLDELAGEVDLDSKSDAWKHTDNLDQGRLIAQRFEERGQKLVDRISKRLDVPWHSLTHGLLASLPINEAATMNYDTLFELACDGARRRFAVLPYQPARTGPRWLLKVHGSIGARPADIVLTREDYLRYADRRAALAGIVQALLITRHILFVGFSLQDETFHRIIDDVRKAVRGQAEADARPATHRREPFATALLAVADSLLPELWKGDIECLVFGGDTTAIALAARKQEIFLDLLLAETTTNTGHLLDPTYRTLLTPGEVAFATAIEGILRDASVATRETAAWEQFLEFIARLGAASSPSE